MSDPTAIGAFVVSAISTGVAAIAKGVAGEAAKDAYTVLKKAVVDFAGESTEVDALETDPRSNERQLILAEIVNKQSETARIELMELSSTLVEVLMSAESKHGPIGVDIGMLHADKVKIDKINIKHGIGVRVDRIKADRTVSISNISASGDPSGN